MSTGTAGARGTAMLCPFGGAELKGRMLSPRRDMRRSASSTGIGEVSSSFGAWTSTGGSSTAGAAGADGGGGGGMADRNDGDDGNDGGADICVRG